MTKASTYTMWWQKLTWPFSPLSLNVGETGQWGLQLKTATGKVWRVGQEGKHLAFVAATVYKRTTTTKLLMKNSSKTNVGLWNKNTQSWGMFIKILNMTL